MSIYSDADRISDEDEEASFAIAPAAQGIVSSRPPPSSMSARKLAASLYNSSPRSRFPSSSTSLSNSDSPPPSVSTHYPARSSKHHDASTDDLQQQQTNDGVINKLGCVRIGSNRTPRAFEEKHIERLIRSIGSNTNNGASALPSLSKELKKQTLFGAQDLESAQMSSRKEVDGLVERFSNEIVVLRAGEQERIEDAVCLITEKLEKEQRSRRKLEIENTRLSNYLLEAETAIARLEKELKKEKKGRKLMEDVCNELAREIGEDKTEVETLKREQSKSRQRTLQMMDAWHEERTQMKLSETKVMAFDKLKMDFDVLLESMKAHRVDSSLMLQGEWLRESMEEIQRETCSSCFGLEDSNSYSHSCIPTSNGMNSSRKVVMKDSESHMHDLSTNGTNSSRKVVRKDSESYIHDQPRRNSHSFQYEEKDSRRTFSLGTPRNNPRYQISTPGLMSPKWGVCLDRGTDFGMIESRRASIGSSADWAKPVKANSLQARLSLEDQMSRDSHLQYSRGMRQRN